VSDPKQQNSVLNNGLMKKIQYKMKKCDGHPRADRNGRVSEHVLIAEEALGKYLPQFAVIHHADGNKRNNSRNNLVICNNSAYHQLIHKRKRAFDACGNPNYLKCYHCGQYDDPGNIYANGKNSCHVYCQTEYIRKHVDRHRKLNPIGWSKDEDYFIHFNRPVLMQKTIGFILGRSEKSVSHRCQRIKKNKSYVKILQCGEWV
jgi:hypothetical protein